MGKEKIQRHRTKVPQLLSTSYVIKISGGSSKAWLSQTRQAPPSSLPQVLSATSQLCQAPSSRCSPQLHNSLPQVLSATPQILAPNLAGHPQVLSTTPQLPPASALHKHQPLCRKRETLTHNMLNVFRVYEELIS